jgi:hypothetical protein
LDGDIAEIISEEECGKGSRLELQKDEMVLLMRNWTRRGEKMRSGRNGTMSGCGHRRGRVVRNPIRPQ